MVYPLQLKSHAYTILGVFNLTDSSGKTVYQLVWIRNPWRFDGYTGPWSDNDPLWKSGKNGIDFRKQVNYTKNANDGLFFLDINTF